MASQRVPNIIAINPLVGGTVDSHIRPITAPNKMALAVLAFISFPVTSASAITFGAVMGLMWLSTVPPTNGLIAMMFGTRWLAMLAGFAFFSHQVGGFLGVWLGGLAYEHTGSYDVVWWLSILFGVLSALVNLPIVEKPIQRIVEAKA